MALFPKTNNSFRLILKKFQLFCFNSTAIVQNHPVVTPQVVEFTPSKRIKVKILLFKSENLTLKKLEFNPRLLKGWLLPPLKDFPTC